MALLRPAGSPRDVRGWFLASFLGTVACMLLYMVFGYIFVRLHAQMISSEMALYARFGMTVLIAPQDPHLTSPDHLLAGSLFFGLTMGVLNALLCMIATLPAWISGRLMWSDLLCALGAGAACVYFTFSHELPWVAVIIGLICPFIFCAVWVMVVKRCRPSRVHRPLWILFSVLILSPLFLALAAGSGFLSIRDSMLSMPVIRSWSTAYYDHTLLAADVIKSADMRTQNAIAVVRGIERIGFLPHGTLWMRTADPCRLKGATLVMGRGGLSCPSIRVPEDGRPANFQNRIIREYAKDHDPNRYMRKGMGLFFYQGGLVAVTLLLLAWFALGLEGLWHRSRGASAVVLAAYLAFFGPSFQGEYLVHRLKSHPENVAEYASSPHESRRYAALSVYPGAIAEEALMSMIEDASPRIRVNALIEAGERRDQALIPLIGKSATDPQLNVRTKACWALGRIGSPRVLEILDEVVKTDPCWYVRDYAYAAMGRIRKEAKVVDLDQEQTTDGHLEIRDNL